MATKRRELLGLTSADVNWFLGLTPDNQPVDDPPRPERDDEGRVIRGCLGKADLDEPIFVLRAQDRCAPFAVRAWAERAKGAGHLPAEKFAEAMALAVEMERWQEAHPNRAKFPD